MKRFIMLILSIPFYVVRQILRFFGFVLKHIFGFLFGWIPDFDERMSGEDFEVYVREILRRIGYQKVTLTKRSGDYGIDILADYHGKTYAIQCKKYAKPVGVSAVQQAYAGCAYYGYDIPVVVTNHRFTTQAISLAQSNGVLLWDKDKLDVLKRKANCRSILHRRRLGKEDSFFYEPVIEVFLEEGYASKQLLMDSFGYTEEKSSYILEDLEFYDLVSREDNLEMRDILFSTKEQAKAMLHLKN